MIEEEIKKLSRSSKPKTCDLDPVPTHLLGQISETLIIPTLTDIVNKSLKAEKKNQKGRFIAIFFAFTSLILPCWRDNFKSFLCVLLNFIPHVTKNIYNRLYHLDVTNNQFSDTFNNGGGYCRVCSCCK